MLPRKGDRKVENAKGDRDSRGHSMCCLGRETGRQWMPSVCSTFCASVMVGRAGGVAGAQLG